MVEALQGLPDASLGDVAMTQNPSTPEVVGEATPSLAGSGSASARPPSQTLKQQQNGRRRGSGARPGRAFVMACRAAMRRIRDASGRVRRNRSCWSRKTPRMDDHYANAAYIALACPANILPLIQALEEAGKASESLGKRLLKTSASVARCRRSTIR